MKKILTTFFILSLFLPTTIFAAPEAPQSDIWVEPKGAKVGEEIELQTFVYNSTARAAIVVVDFTDDKGAAIGQDELSIPSQTAKIATVTWKMPATSVVVTATVTKASDANKQSITELIGLASTATIGGVSQSQFIPEGITNTIKHWFTTAFAFIEPWRKSQAAKFTAIRNEARLKAGVAAVKEIGNALTPEAPATPGENADDLEGVTHAPRVPLGSYLTLIYSTALATLFSSIAIFYITLTLATLMLLRFLIARFFS